MSTEREKLRFIWGAMVRRCIYPTDKAYKNYGGRGILVCRRWMDSFDLFVSDMGPRPIGYVLDRVDNDGDYCPENCKWATRYESSANRRNSKWVHVGGERVCLKEACRRIGITYRPIAKRIANGWDTHTALYTPLGAKGNGFINNKAQQ